MIRIRKNGVFPAEVPLKKDYDGIKIPASKELDDNMITAIIFGSTLKPERLNRCMTLVIRGRV